MYLIWDTKHSAGVFMKTPMGLVMIACSTQDLTESFINAISLDSSHHIAISPEALVQSAPNALKPRQKILLFPSADVIRKYFDDREGFRALDFVLEWGSPKSSVTKNGAS